MAIPDRWTLTLPVLQRLSQGRCTTGQMIDAMVEHFGLTEEERQRRSSGGRIVAFNNQIHWILGAELGIAKLVNRVSKGLYEITDRGREVLVDPPPKIDSNYLFRFPEYAAKYGGRRDEAAAVARCPSDDEVRVLHALLNATTFTGRDEVSRIGAWVKSRAIHDSQTPHRLPMARIPSIVRSLQRAGLVECGALGSYPAMRLTQAGYDALAGRAYSSLADESGYGVDSIIAEGCFLPREKIEATLDLLRRKKNLVLQGPPGTGKTWLAKRLGYALLGAKKREQVLSVQFQPSLSYEDFVRGWRFSGGQFALVDGVFLEAAERARESSEPFVLVIEEINRGNPAQILGDLLTLIDADKRDASEAIRLSYVKDQEESFFIPPNLYIIGTMNVADRSLALVDFALRRRFAFVDLEPQLGQEWAKWCRGAGVPAALVTNVQQRLNELNSNIASDKSLGRQFCIGHSFVTPAPGEPARDWHAWFKSVAESEIGPLLREYWYDNASMADKEINKLLAGL